MKRTLRLITSVLVMSLYAVGVQAQGQYYLFHSATDDTKGSDNDKALVDATLYKSVQDGKKWTSVGQNASSNFQVTSFTSDELESHKNDNNINANSYYKVPVKPMNYYQLALQWKAVSYSETQNCNFISTDSWTETTTWTETTINQYHSSDGEANNCVRFAIEGEYDYYVVSVTTDYSPTFPDAPSTDLTDDQKSSATELTSPPASGNVGSANVYVLATQYFYFKVPKYNYFKKLKSWSNPLETLPDGQTATNASWTVSELSSHISENPGYYAVPADFQYYYVENNYKWQQENYNSGDQKQLIATYANESEMVAPTAADQYCTVGGSSYTKANGSWNSDVVETSWDATTGTLTIGTDETRTISEILTSENVSDNSAVQKIVFADGSVWERQTNGGKLTATDNESEHATALKNAGFMVSYYENDILTVGPGDETASALLSVVQTLSAGEATKVVFADGSEWDRTTSKLTVPAPASSNATAHKEALQAAGYTVDEVETTTNYPNVTVTVDANGVVTITSQSEGALEAMLNSNDAEANAYKDMINGAKGTGSKIVLSGPFKAADLTALTNLNNQTESVDMRNTTFSNDADAKFTYWDSNTLKTVYMSNDPTITTIPEAYFQNMKNIENLYIGESVTTIPEYRFQSLTSLKYVSIPSSVVTIGQYAFNNCTNLTDIDWSDNCHVKTIGKAAFAYSGYKGTNGTFTVPNSVERIEENAFERCNNITTLIFDTGSNISYIGKSAFAQDESVAGTLSNVYVNVQPARQITCERGAFDKFHTCAQTQVGTVTTRLHYPSEYYDYYVGNYKATLYDQNNDVKNEDGTWALDEHGQRIHSYGLLTTQSMINEAYAQATNGWQEFMSSGIPVGEGSLYRTYSDDNAYLVPNVGSLQIFLVHNYDKDQNQAECIQMIEGDVIPVNTGIIVHSNVAATIYLTRATDQTATPYNHEDYPDNKYTKSGQQYNNYLKPINGSMHIDNVEIVNGTRTYRNYFFNNGTTAALRPAPDWNESYAVKGWGFFRAGTADYTVWNKAFLHLPAAMTVASSTIIDDSGNLPQDQLETTSPAKSFGLYIIGGPEHVVSFGSVGIATAINKPVTEVNDGVYYTIQGVKVDKPTQNGIYIHNGKKVVVK